MDLPSDPGTTIAEPNRLETLDHLPIAIDLPGVDHVSDSVILSDIDTELLQLRLIGGESAYRQGSFSISKGPRDDAWSVIHHGREVAEIAKLTSGVDTLGFRWTAAAASSAAAKYLCNTVLCLTRGEGTARVALRQPNSINALPADLTQGITRHKLPIEFPPALSELFVEFMPADDSLAAAIETAVMPAEGGQLWLGLESGRKSLFMLLVRSRMRKWQALELVPHSRTRQGDPPRPLTPTILQQLQQEMAVGKRTLFAGKATLDAMKGSKRKASARARLRKLEAHLKALANFAAAFDAAHDTRLCFRVFRRVEDLEVDLLHVGNVGGSVPNPRLRQ